jgi:hypothetical protein
MQYPGRIIRAGEPDADIVKAVKRQLNEALRVSDEGAFRLDPNDPNFGPRVERAVKLFQARHVDATGHPLTQDGEIGMLTWAVLFGPETVPEHQQTGDEFLLRVVQIAAEEARREVREVPTNSNDGPDVRKYLRSVGLGPGFAWCCAFMYWSFDEAAQQLGRPNPMVKTAGCLDHWNRAEAHGARRIRTAEALDTPDAIAPGMVFVMDHGHGLGHTGIVEEVASGLLTTIEGNTDASRTREGGGVYRLTRKINQINLGFIDYSGSTG